MKKLVFLFVLSLGMMTTVNAQVKFTVQMPNGAKMSFTQNGNSKNLPCCNQIVYYKKVKGDKTESRIPDGYWHFPVFWQDNTLPGHPHGSFILAGPQRLGWTAIKNFLINLIQII